MCLSSGRWQSVLLNVLSSCVIFFAALFSVVDRDTISGGNVGLSVSFAVKTAFFITTIVHAATKIETMMVPVERVKEYSEIKEEVRGHTHTHTHRSRHAHTTRSRRRSEVIRIHTLTDLDTHTQRDQGGGQRSYAYTHSQI